MFERLPEPSLDEAVSKEKRDGCQQPSRFELPLLGSNQDSPDPESGVLPVTPRGSTAFDCHGAEGDRTPDLCSAIAALSQLSYSPRDSSREAVNLAGGGRPVNARCGPHAAH